METNIKLKHVYLIDSFIIDKKSKMISIPQSWMEQYGKEQLPENIKSMLDKNYTIQLNIL